MPDSNLSTSIAAVKTKITTDAPTATVDEILSLARAAKSVGLSEDAAVESAINSRVLTLSSGATTANMVKLSNAIKQMRDATAASSSSSVDLTAVSTNIIPDTDVTYDLGSSTHKFKDLYLDGNTLNLGNQTIKATATGIEVPELKIGTGTNTVKLTVASDGKLTTTETDSSGNTSSPAAAGGGGSSVTVSDTAPTSPSAGDQWFDSSSLTMFVYYADGSSSQWVPATPAGQTGATGATGSDGAAGSSVTSYANLAAFPSSGNTNGDIAYANDTNGVYMWSNSTWQRMSVGSNIGPIFTTTPTPTLQLSNDGTSTVSITAAAIDEGAFPVTYDWDAYSGTTLYNASSLPPQVTAVTQSGGVFTLTGSNTTSNAGGFSFRSKASDGVSTTTAITTCNLSFLNGTLLRTQRSDVMSTTDYFGYSVALGTDYYAVGEMGDDGTNANGGQVWIYNMSDGTQKHKLQNPSFSGDTDPSGDYFGRQVAMNDTYTIASSSGADYGSTYTSVGAVHVYNTVSGSLLHSHQPPTADITESTLLFGYALDLSTSGTYFITSAYADSATGGKAYVYNTSTGNLVYNLTNPNVYDTVTDDFFGHGVTMGETYFAVAAAREDTASYLNAGVVYVYNMSDGSLRHTIQNPAANADDAYMGYQQSMKMTDTHLVIGVSRQTVNGNANAGAVYVYNPDTGNLLYTINNPNTTAPAGDYFGSNISVSTNYIVVSAPDKNSDGDGVVYVFNRFDGSLLYTIQNPNTDTTDSTDEFGRAVDISDTRIIIGAYSETGSGNNFAGASYLYN